MNYRIVLFLLFFPMLSFSQKNALKFNLVGPFSKLYSVQYERALGEGNTSFVLTGFHRNRSQIPFGPELDKLAKSNGIGLTGIDFEYIFIDQAQVGVTGISPEFRFYLTKKKNRPFLGLYGLYEHYDMSIPASLIIPYRGNDAAIITPVVFDTKTLTGGLLLGQQFRFGRFGLDLVLIGGHSGRALNVTGTVNQGLLSQLNSEDKELLKTRIVERFDLNNRYYTAEIGENSATVSSSKKVPFFGFRGGAVNLAYYF